MKKGLSQRQVTGLWMIGISILLGAVFVIPECQPVLYFIPNVACGLRNSLLLNVKFLATTILLIFGVWRLIKNGK